MPPLPTPAVLTMPVWNASRVSARTIRAATSISPAACSTTCCRASHRSIETRDRIKRFSVARYRDVKPLGQEVPDCPNYVIALVNKAMDLNAERRFQTPGEMLEDLNKAIKRVKSGDKGIYVSRGELASRTNADESTADGDTPIEREGEDRTVMLVESSVSMQDTIRNALEETRISRAGFRRSPAGIAAFRRTSRSGPAGRLRDLLGRRTGRRGGRRLQCFWRRGSNQEHPRHLAGETHQQGSDSTRQGQ